MLKQILISTIVATSVMFLAVVYLKSFDRIPSSTIEFRVIDVEPPKPDLSPIDIEVQGIITEVNQKNQEFKTFFCDEVDIRIWENGHRFKLFGEIAYEKPNGFRMEVSSIFGHELDLGSNNQEFWYWSRRDRHPGLYWAIHEDFGKTRLKTPFNPMFMRSSLGLEVLDPVSAKIVTNEKDIMLTYARESSMGDPILFSVFVNKAQKQIDGFLITDINGKTLVTCEIRSHVDGLPDKILYTWHEEERTMSLAFRNQKSNSRLRTTSFLMPSYKPKINMAEE